MNRTLKRPAWIWQASASTGVRVLKEIRPWLRSKAAEADIALAFWNERTFAKCGPDGRFVPLTQEARELILEAETQLRAAKRIDYPEFVDQLVARTELALNQLSNVAAD